MPIQLLFYKPIKNFMFHKKLIAPVICLLFLLIATSGNAKDYYISNLGSDYNSGTDVSSPWKTIDKLNSFNGLLPGDKIYFKRGETFYGTLKISRSGTSGSPITYGAYGIGEKPIITGFVPITDWVNTGLNIWESANRVSWLPYTNIVTVSNVSTPMGRYPNAGFLTYESFSGNSAITSSGLQGWPNWTGADVVIKKNRYTVETGVITNHVGNTLSYREAQIESPTKNFGFFIKNDIKTLDQQNEWYYNPVNGKLSIYSIGKPNDVKVSTIDILVDGDWKVGSGDYVTVENIRLEGANLSAVYIDHKDNFIVRNCDIVFAGDHGIEADGSNYLTLENNSISYVNGNAVRLSGTCPNATVQYNTIKSSGMMVGMVKNWAKGSIAFGADNTLVQYNNIDSSGYNGIFFTGNNITIKNNFINHSCLILDDGAGIYTAGNTKRNRLITGNIVLNSIGNAEGTDNPTGMVAHGIYMDAGTAYVTISDNTTSGCRGTGIFIHRSQDISVTNNTSYNNGTVGSWLRGEMMLQYSKEDIVRNLQIENNIFFSKTVNQYSLFYYSNSTNDYEIQNLGISDNNYFTRPIDESNIINIQEKLYDLSGWKSFSGQDRSSKTGPKTINSIDELRFEYNPTGAARTIALDGKYLDVKGNSYNGSITLQPYRSAVLIRDGEKTIQSTPVASAGEKQTITLPKNTATLTGNGSVNNGTITSYYWSQISGDIVTIESPNTATTNITNLSEGVYKFQLQVTDNNGAIATSIVEVEVVASKESQVLLPALNPSNLVNGLEYKYFEDFNYTQLPNFTISTPLKEGVADGFDISVASRHTGYSINFQGYIDIPSDGVYTFFTTSDDGSNLFIDDILVVNNDGLHGAVEKSGEIGLKAGKHKIASGYFQSGGGAIMSVSYAGPDIVKQVIPAGRLYRTVQTDLSPAVQVSNPVNGLEYQYAESWNLKAVPDFSNITVTKKGIVNDFNLSVAGRSEYFAINFVGYIEVPADGEYTFYTASDDGSLLFIDDRIVVNNDGLHNWREQSGIIGLKAGKHLIRVGFFQASGGKSLEVSYSGPGISKQTVPGSALFRDANALSFLPAVNGKNFVNGLDYRYYESNNYTAMPDFGAVAPLKVGNINNFDLSVANRSEEFAIQFTGYIDIPIDGIYTFYTGSDDGSVLYIDNFSIVENDGLHHWIERSGSVALSAGKHLITVGFFQGPGNKALEVSYSGPGLSKRLVPSSVLYREQNELSKVSNNFGENSLASIKPIKEEAIGFESNVGIEVYPNPFADFVSVTLKGASGDFDLVLMDALGRVLMKRKGVKNEGYYKLAINTSAFQKGTYFLKVTCGEGKKTIKLLK